MDARALSPHYVPSFVHRLSHRLSHLFSPSFCRTTSSHSDIPTYRVDMDCPFKALGLKPSAGHTRNKIHDAYIDAVKEAHTDWGGTLAAHVRVEEAYACLKKNCRRAFDKCRSSECNCQNRWCTICQAFMSEHGSQEHDQWHRCRMSGCNEMGIRLLDHLVDKHQFQACDECAQPQSPDHFWQHGGLWWCCACEGYVEGHLEARIPHLEQHLLCAGPEWFTTDLQALAAYVRAKQYQRCPVCPAKIMAGMLRRHRELGHSFVACLHCPTSDDGMDEHVRSAHPSSACHECQQQHQQDRLRVHLRQVHSYEVCQRCPLVVPPGTLNSHMEQHGWSCCGKRFNTQGAFRKHIQRGCNQEKEKQCPDCGMHVTAQGMGRHRGSAVCKHRMT